MTDLAAELLTFICFDQYQAQKSFTIILGSSGFIKDVCRYECDYVRASEFLVIEINKRHHHMIQTMNPKDKK